MLKTAFYNGARAVKRSVSDASESARGFIADHKSAVQRISVGGGLTALAGRAMASDISDAATAGLTTAQADASTVAVAVIAVVVVIVGVVLIIGLLKKS